MRYVGGSAKESGCIFCRRLQSRDDVASLVIHRGRHAFTIMNLYPYNIGHVMQVPNQHSSSPEETEFDALAEIATALPVLLRSLRRVLDCQGFNVGLNVGAIAGAGIAEHMHQHVVPRWQGDANFMPIIGRATVMPELIPVTYAKIRAELARITAPAPRPAALVILDRERRVALDSSGRLPRVDIPDGQSVWRGAVDHVASLGVQATVAGWSGPVRADEPGIGLILECEANPPARFTWVTSDSIFAEPDRSFLMCV
jgi:ATP adenylyltransferase